MSRLRAYEILGDAAYRSEAIVALETTRASLLTSLASSTPDFCLCHGLAGNAEIVEHGARVLGAASVGGDPITARVAQHGAVRFGLKGATEQQTRDEPPGLMHGLAGIGTYLRRARPATPSPLLLGREMFVPSPGLSLHSDAAAPTEGLALETASRSNPADPRPHDWSPVSPPAA